MNNRELIQILEEEEGIDESNQASVALDSCQPGICRDCHNVSSPHEPDACNNWCPHCNG